MNKYSETLYFYDNKTFRLTQLKTIRTANGTSLQDLCYTYDAAGNVVEIVDQAQETSYYGNSQIEPRHLYTYDALYRILTGTGRELIGLAKATAGGYASDSVNAADAQALHNFTQHFQYDALGNILEIQHVTPNSTLNWTRHYVYDTATNRLLKHDPLQTLNDYTYDSHGNITTMPHLPQMQWTFDDKLKEATLNAGGDKAYYVYDSAGNRTRKVVEKGIIREERFYLNNYEVYRKYSSNTLTIERTTAHVMDDKQRIATIDHETGGQTTVRYQVNNHLGSSSIELNESGVILTYEEYHPFGTTAYQKHNTNISQKRYKYVGKERDEETGLYYYGFRFYAPWLCRFVSVDPLQHKYPQYTPFQYAGNKPITFIDLDGLEEARNPTYEKKMRFDMVESEKGKAAFDSLMNRNLKSPLFQRIITELDTTENFKTEINIINREPGFGIEPFPSYKRKEEFSKIPSEIEFEETLMPKNHGGAMYFNTLIFQPEKDFPVKEMIDFFSEGSIEEFVHAWQNLHYSQKYGNLIVDLPGLSNIEYEGKSIKGIIKMELGLPLSASPDSILEKYGQDVYKKDKSIEEYLKFGRSWRSNPDIHDMYKMQKETNHLPEVLINIHYCPIKNEKHTTIILYC
jgi:RHS repeat-associated protein